MANAKGESSVLSSVFSGKPIPVGRVKDLFQRTHGLPALNLHEDPRFLTFFKSELSQPAQVASAPPNRSSNQVRKQMRKEHALFTADSQMRSQHHDDYQKYERHGLYYTKNSDDSITPTPMKDPSVRRYWKYIHGKADRIKNGTIPQPATPGSSLKDEVTAAIRSFRSEKYPSKQLYYSNYTDHPLFSLATDQNTDEDIIDVLDRYPPDTNTSVDLPEDLTESSNSGTNSVSESRSDDNTSRPTQQTQQNNYNPQRFNPQSNRASQRISRYSRSRKKGAPASRASRMAGRGAKFVSRVAKISRLAPLLTSPAFWIGLGILLFLLLFIFVLSKGKSDSESENYPRPEPSPVPGTDDGLNPRINLNKSGPGSISNGENITYTITVSYSGGGNVNVHDTIPLNAEFVTATGNYTPTTNETGRVTQVSWSLRDNQSVAQPAASPTPSQSTGVNFSQYTQSPYFLPTPEAGETFQFSEEELASANQLGSLIAQNQTYLLTKVKNNDPKYVDPFLAVLWTMVIEGSGADPYSWNCNDVAGSINDGCVGWFNSGDWQVGGIQVAQVSDHLADDFRAIYGNGDAATVQQVGQRVIDGGGITNPSQFPAKSIDEIIAQAGRPGNPGVERPTTTEEAQAQQLIAILLMDPAINAINLSLEIAGDIASQDNWRATMQGWGVNYYITNMQTFSNKGNALAQVYSGDGITTPTMTGSFSLTVKPGNDVVVQNTAWADELGGGSPAPDAGGGGMVNTENCDGFYSLDNPYYGFGRGANFGDPDCELTTPESKDKIYAMLKQLDPIYANDWFFQIIPCEAPGYDPNTYASHESIGTPDPVGAWGLYQMGRGRNGELDHGDVPWQNQTTNALGYNRMLLDQGIGFRYWACAEYLWQGEN